MHRFATIVIIAGFATPALAGWDRIENKQDLSQHVVGKSFVESKSKAWFQLRPNGKLASGHNGKKLTGAWKWTKGRVCYTRKLGGEKLPNDCIAIHIDGNKLTTTRQSNGTTVHYVRAK